MALFIHKPWLTTMLWLVCAFPVNEGAANDDASFASEIHCDFVLSIVTDQKHAGKR
jgi:hypothetical protein